MVVLMSLLIRSSIEASCTEVSMWMSTGALAVMVGAGVVGVAGIRLGEARVTVSASSSLVWTVRPVILGMTEDDFGVLGPIPCWVEKKVD